MLRVFGPPGTGKTTTLLNMVDRALADGVEPSRIAFLAFTKAAANEAKERAAARFNLNAKEDLIFFRTLHSLALTMSDIRPEQVIQEENYRELSRKKRSDPRPHKFGAAAKGEPTRSVQPQRYRTALEYR